MRASSVRHGVVYPRLPGVGLGNMMLVWARAVAFSHLNGLPMIAPRWVHFHPRQFLRSPSDVRLYAGSFSHRGEIRGYKRAFHLASLPRILEPPIARLEDGGEPSMYVFARLPHWADYFAEIREHRDLLLSAVWSAVKPDKRAFIHGAPCPIVAVHIRHGDFRHLRPGEDFASTGQVRAPMDYYSGLIRSLRRAAGSPLPVTVYSDGQDEELAAVLSLPGVERAPRAAPIVDLLSISRARVIIPAPSSTFSLWSSFLSDAVVLHHPDHFHKSCRPDSINGQRYEGPVPRQEWSPEFIARIVACLDGRP